MASSFDRTLIQQLGAETDHKTQDHDLACLYLQENARRLADRFYPRLPTKTFRWDRQSLPFVEEHYERVEKDVRLCSGCATSLPNEVEIKWEPGELGKIYTNLEVPVSKGSGQYKSTVGFLDIEITVSGREGFATLVSTPLTRRCYLDEGHGAIVETLHQEQRFPFTLGNFRRIVVEVKTRPVPLGDVIRQIGRAHV
jgi:hypothetical protein